MSDDSSAEIAAARRDWKTEHLTAYMQSDGTEGHVVDLSDIGGHNFTPTLLVRYVGRKSGKAITTPLIYGTVGGEVVIVASKGGADHHPAWYLNIREMQDLEFQVATQAYRASWREPGDDERDTIWNYMVSVFPPYRDYQASTERQIPLVLLKAIEPIEPITGGG
jgi:deazaflavin-dependent oxidoreductase (nitroreductase family)